MRPRLIRSNDLSQRQIWKLATASTSLLRLFDGYLKEILSASEIQAKFMPTFPEASMAKSSGQVKQPAG